MSYHPHQRQGSPTVNPENLGPLAPLVDALADAVAARLGDRDELVAIAPEPLAALGLEHAAVVRLVAEGRLRAVTIGRRRFTKRSYLLALVDELPVAVREDTPAHDDLEVAVRKMAVRKAAKARRATEAASKAAV